MNGLETSGLKEQYRGESLDLPFCSGGPEEVGKADTATGTDKSKPRKSLLFPDKGQGRPSKEKVLARTDLL